MFNVGNLRVRKRDGSIWAHIVEQNKATDSLFLCPFDQSSGIHNVLDNGFDFDYCYVQDSSTSTGEYVGGLIGCNKLEMDLSESWSVTFEYVYTGDTAEDKTNYSTNTLATDWNVIFGFGTHILSGFSTVDYLYFTLPLYSFKPYVSEKEYTWCNTTNPQTWHRYVIQYADNTTTVTIDNVPQETKQFVYPDKVKGFYLSGGGYRHSLACKIKNLSIVGTLAS